MVICKSKEWKGSIFDMISIIHATCMGSEFVMNIMLAKCFFFFFFGIVMLLFSFVKYFSQSKH